MPMVCFAGGGKGERGEGGRGKGGRGEGGKGGRGGLKLSTDWHITRLKCKKSYLCFCQTVGQYNSW